MAAYEPAPQPWDHNGHHLSAAKKIIRAAHRGTGCHLTFQEAQMLNFAEGDGDWWNQLLASMGYGFKEQSQ